MGLRLGTGFPHQKGQELWELLSGRPNTFQGYGCVRQQYFMEVEETVGNHGEFGNLILGRDDGREGGVSIPKLRKVAVEPTARFCN